MNDQCKFLDVHSYQVPEYQVEQLTILNKQPAIISYHTPDILFVLKLLYSIWQLKEDLRHIFHDLKDASFFYIFSFFATSYLTIVRKFPNAHMYSDQLLRDYRFVSKM